MDPGRRLVLFSLGPVAVRQELPVCLLLKGTESLEQNGSETGGLVMDDRLQMGGAGRLGGALMFPGSLSPS